jgi:curli biogenesis system outer membrane secretion channel CsgG
MKTGRYRVVEREGLEQLIDELDMSNSGYAEPGSVPRSGHLADLEYLFIVKITNLGENIRNATVPLPFLGGVGRQSDEAYVRLDFRIVDATTGDIVLAGYGEGTDKSSGATFLGWLFSTGFG